MYEALNINGIRDLALRQLERIPPSKSRSLWGNRTIDI